MLNSNIEQIKITKYIVDKKLVRIVELSPIPIEITKVRNSLHAVCTEKVLSIFIENNVKIIIASNEIMAGEFGVEKILAPHGFFMPPANAIYINQDLFSYADKERSDFLTTVIANEVSHASIYNQHPFKSEDNYNTLVPWTNDSMRRKFKEAMNKFNQAIEDYQECANKSLQGINLDAEEQHLLQKGDNVLMSYIPAYAHGRTNLERYSTDWKNDNTIKRTMPSHILDEFKNKIPPISEPQKRLLYLRESFFVDKWLSTENQRSAHSEKFGPYQGDKNHKFADKLSDFEMLPPKMRKFFGPELCDLLSNYFNEIDHCACPWLEDSPFTFNQAVPDLSKLNSTPLSIEIKEGHNNQGEVAISETENHDECIVRTQKNQEDEEKEFIVGARNLLSYNEANNLQRINSNNMQHTTKHRLFALPAAKEIVTSMITAVAVLDTKTDDSPLTAPILLGGNNQDTPQLEYKLASLLALSSLALVIFLVYLVIIKCKPQEAEESTYRFRFI